MMRRAEIDGSALYCGSCRDILPTLPKASIDAIITDPPYSSGGLHRSDRAADPKTKYTSEFTKGYASFSGDNRDQRTFTLWCSDWLEACLRAARPGAALFCFIDWRNLPCIIDALQIGGWVYRGIIPWNKTEAARPRPGWFRSQCEYIVTATAGPLTMSPQSEGEEFQFAPGFFTLPVVGGEKVHITEKPVPLMEWLLGIRAEWQTVLDPFMGSGSTGVAALSMGRKFVGIEVEEHYYSIACKRIEQASARQRLMPAPVSAPLLP